MGNHRRGWAELALGLLLLGTACGLWQENSRSDRQAAAASQQLLAQVRLHMETGHTPPSAAPAPPRQEAPLPSPTPAGSEETLGILEIPALSLTLPVWADWGEDLLKQAPCRYVPPGAAQPRFVICGHNYRSQFGGLHRLAVGDAVRFTDLEGRMQRYTVSETSNIPQDDFEALETGDWDLALFTCTPSHIGRVLIRCRRGE
ncbi:MAG: sortase [Pseudoflavonifractor sp.]